MLSLRDVLKIIITTIIFLVTCSLYNYLLGKHLSSASHQLQNLLLSIINKESQLSYIHTAPNSSSTQRQNQLINWTLHLKFEVRFYFENCKELKPFNPLKWPGQNFSLQNQYDIKQTSDENKEKYLSGITCWFNTKFSELTLWELYGRQ